MRMHHHTACPILDCDYNRAVGIEIEERYCEIAATRCAQGVLGLGRPAPVSPELAALLFEDVDDPQ